MKQNLFKETTSLLIKYRECVQLNIRQNEFLDEILTRLKLADKEYYPIVKLNSKLLDTSPFTKEIEEFRTPENMYEFLISESKNDPVLANWLSLTKGKLIKVQSAQMSSYNMNNLEKLEKNISEKVLNLDRRTESFYDNLWLIKERLNTLPKFKNFGPKGVIGIRNNLMVHTDNYKNSNAYIFSFGVGSGGPFIRPVKPEGSPAPNDRGFEVNVNEFLLSIKGRIDN